MSFRRNRARANNKDPASQIEIRGPSSALTEFLREQGINAETIRSRYEESLLNGSGENIEEIADELISEANANGANIDQSNNGNDNPDDDADDDDEEVLEGDDEAALENEDAVIKKIKRRAILKRKKNGANNGDDADDIDDDEKLLDENESEGKNYCFECDNEFTINVYSKKMEKFGRIGYLCPTCTNIQLQREKNAKRNEYEARKRRKLIATALLDKQSLSFPTLQDKCIQIISNNIDDVELLGDIGIINLKKICRILSKNRSLNNETMKLFLDKNLNELEFWDCSKIDSDSLNLIPIYIPNLSKLVLNMCGQLHNDNLVFYSKKFQNLTYLKLNGPFLINESMWQEFFDSENIKKNLKEFHIYNTHRFTNDSLISLLDNCGNHLTGLTLSRLDGLDSKSCYDLLAHYLINLEFLEISYPTKEEIVDDNLIINILANNGQSLNTLVLDGCSGLTDSFLITGLKPFALNLTKLSVALLDQITDEGVFQLFNDWEINGGLMDVNFQRCTELGDKSIYQFLNHSQKTLVELNLNSIKKITSKLFFKISRNLRLPLLTYLDLGFVRSCDDKVLAILSRICPKLAILEVYGNNRCTADANVRSDLRIIGRESDSI
ncbi:unnamed protein product [[Candida] boidinii]|uniref:Unnamed protein product n=1 Tax=Candida boidinii TaxID=5477 RepID=A0A9W6SZT1_CANBO|nr:hypothetical protein B5S30_g3271 [[Candida] boidinii]GME69533.1 unnamed protein product [[Candida] boidinii]